MSTINIVLLRNLTAVFFLQSFKNVRVLENRHHVSRST